jgi:hypothetical protein
VHTNTTLLRELTRNTAYAVAMIAFIMLAAFIVSEILP